MYFRLQWFWRILLIMTVVIQSTASFVFAEDGENTTQDNPLQLESVTVTAHKVEQDVQDVSASISVFDGAELDELGFTNLRDLPMLVPNLGMQQIGNHYTEFNYRGIGGVTTMSKTWNINVDGVTVPYVGIDTMFDVERIEVLRGGQGALYGRNTHAGVINIITRTPSDKPEAEAEASYGSFNSRRVTGAVSGPAGESFKYRLAFQHEATDGYMDSEVHGDGDANWSDQVKGHGKLVYQANPDTDITFSIMADNYSGTNDGWVNYGTDSVYDSTSDYAGKEDGGLFTGSLTVRHAFADMELTSITAYSNSRYETGADMDATLASIYELTDYEETYNTFTQELRLASSDRDARLRWLTGLFFLAEKTDCSTLMGIMGTAYKSESSINTYGGAWFGELAYDITPSLELEGTLRLDVERRNWFIEDSDSGAEHSEGHTWFAPLPSATLTYEISPEHSVYGLISRGYRAGDYVVNEVDVAGIGEDHVVDPEYTLTYELGYKGMAFNKRLRFNAATFWIDWTNMQVTAVVDGSQVRDNAGRAHSYGVEADVSWLAAKGLNIFANAGWMNAEFDDYEGHPTGDPTGNMIPNTNEYSIGCGLSYMHDSGFFGSMTVTHFGPKYLEELNVIKQDPYTLANAKLGYRANNWNVEIFGKNLFDEEYLVRAFQTATGMAPARYASPLSIGVQVGCNFEF